MPANQNDEKRHVGQDELAVLSLRDALRDAKTSGDAARIQAVLIEVVDGLITQLARQSRAIEDMRSDLSHKQGIVTKIDGSQF